MVNKPPIEPECLKGQGWRRIDKKTVHRQKIRLGITLSDEIRRLATVFLRSGDAGRTVSMAEFGPDGSGKGETWGRFEGGRARRRTVRAILRDC
tara:strand:+ start:992 stop:1273 length:282 start_codon:yes stop_codon:yes gene_type:complete